MSRPAAHSRTAEADGGAAGAGSAGSLLERDTIRVTGSEAEAYLQGQISADVCAMADGDTAWSLALAPSGRMVALFRIHRVSAEEFLIDVDAGYGEALTERLRRFVLRTDVRFEPVDAAIPAPLAWPGVSDPADERQRILALMPRMGAEITEATIPAEAGQAVIEAAVSFTKGCYTGQELVARIDSRGGNVPRPVRVLRAEGTVQAGAEVVFDAAVVGQVTSACGDVALAPLKRSVQIGAEVEVGGVAAVVIEPRSG